jgi:cytochrome c
MRPLLALLLALAATPALAADGKALFDDKCAECHTLGDASSDAAPTLKGVAGRKIASLTDFEYSDALKAKGGVWTDAALDAFLASPKTFAPGAQMMFGGVSDPGDRQAIIDYLKTVK